MMLVTSPLVSTREMDVGGFVIPPRTGIVFDTKAINRHPDVWPRPDDFWPERFTEPDSEHKYSLHIFGLGKRRCLGQNYAQLIVKVMLCMILQRFVPTPRVPPQPAPAGPFGFPPTVRLQQRTPHQKI